MNNCSDGLRLSLFDSAACPGLGVQHDTTIFANTTGYYQFDSLKSNQAYILVIDEMNTPCRKTNCTLVFNLSGNALPMELLNFDVQSRTARSADIKWTCTDDRSIIRYVVMRTVNGEKVKVGEIQSQKNIGVNHYSMLDPDIQAYPASYELFGMTSNGDLKSYGTRVLFGGISEQSLIAFPNPGSSTFSLRLDETDIRPADILIYDSKGLVVYKQTGIRLHEAFEIDCQDWAEGIYHIQVLVGGEMYRLEFVINRG